MVFNKLLKSPKGGEVADMGVVGVNDTEFNNPASEEVSFRGGMDKVREARLGALVAELLKFKPGIA